MRFYVYLGAVPLSALRLAVSSLEPAHRRRPELARVSDIFGT